MTDTEDEDLRSRTDARLERRSEEERMARLAKTLVGLSPKQQRRLDLDDGLAEALDEAARMPNGRALARQLRIVRRHLRDGDVDAVERDVDRLLNPQPNLDAPKKAAAADPMAVWAERLIEEGSVESFMEEHPQADRQRLRTLLRNLSKAKPKAVAKAKRALITALEEQ